MKNSTIIENLNEGTSDWQITRFHLDDPPVLRAYPLNRNLRSSVIEGYCSKTSIFPNEDLEFFVSVKPACNFNLDIFRLGYYSGYGGCHKKSFKNLNGIVQPVPLYSNVRLRNCKWKRSLKFKIPNNWKSGVYLGKLSRSEEFGPQSYVIFIVKDEKVKPILVQTSDFTWQAYNKWPGMDSLYDDGCPETYTPRTGNCVSFNRPYSKYFQAVDTPLSLGTGEYLVWEYPLSYWLEKEGYDVSYCSNMDTHANNTIISNSRIFISVGHDEYWTTKMKNNVKNAIKSGVNVLFLSGNSISAEIKPIDESKKNIFRSFCRGDKIDDDIDILGSSSLGPGYGDWTVTNSNHWIYKNTLLKNGDRINGLIGFEYHGGKVSKIDANQLVIVAKSKILRPPARPSRIEMPQNQMRDNEIYSTNKFNGPPGYPNYSYDSIITPQNDDNESDYHVATIYNGPKNNIIFNAGTIWWSSALSNPPGYFPPQANVFRNTDSGVFTYGGRSSGLDKRIQIITSNILNKCLNF